MSGAILQGAAPRHSASAPLVQADVVAVPPGTAGGVARQFEPVAPRAARQRAPDLQQPGQSMKKAHDRISFRP
jgi:hypothetical protein